MALNKIKEEGLTVSNSRLNQWRRCHRAHYYKYVMKLSPKVKGPALVRGSAIHECLEYYYSGKSWKKPQREFEEQFNKMYLSEERALLGDLPKMVYDLMVGYVECWEQEDEELDFLEQELEFIVPLFKGEKIYIKGFIDFIAEDNKGIILGETKTHKRFPEYDVRLFNTQSSIYAWVVRDALNKYPDKKVNRIMWNYIKAKQPTEPRLLKDGKTLSKAKLDSLPGVVYRAIKSHGLDPKKYQDLISAQDYSNYYRREVLRIDDRVVKSVLEDTRDTAIQIYKHPLYKDRNISKDCSFCDFKSLCQAELCNPGSDLDYIIKADFEIREIGGKKDGKSKKEKFNQVPAKKARNRK